MGHAGGDTHQHRQFLLLRVFKGDRHHVVGLLLVRGFERRNHGKLTIEARVLLVLRGMHRGVVGHQNNEAAVDASHTAINKRVGTDVESYMLHTNQGALTHERHTQSGFHSRLLVGAPTAVHAAFLRQGITLDKLCDFGRRRTRIGIHARESGVECS